MIYSFIVRFLLYTLSYTEALIIYSLLYWSTIYILSLILRYLLYTLSYTEVLILHWQWNKFQSSTGRLLICIPAESCQFFAWLFSLGFTPSTNFKPNTASTCAELQFLVSAKVRNNVGLSDQWYLTFYRSQSDFIGFDRRTDTLRDDWWSKNARHFGTRTIRHLCFFLWFYVQNFQ